MLPELQKYSIPENFTGIRLKHLCEQIISSWQALNLAFDNGTLQINETRENTIKLFSFQLAAYVYNCEVEKQDIIEFLSIYLDKYFLLIIQDNSDEYVDKYVIINQIATRLLEIYNELEEGKETKYLQMLADIEEYRKQSKQVKNVVNNVQSSDEEDSQDDEQNEQQQQQQQQFNDNEDDDDEDDDGFIKVTWKGKR